MNEATAILLLTDIAEQHLEKAASDGGPDDSQATDIRTAIALIRDLMPNGKLPQALVMVSVTAEAVTYYSSGTVDVHVVDWRSQTTPPIIPKAFRDIVDASQLEKDVTFDDQNTRLTLAYHCIDACNPEETLVLRGAITQSQILAIALKTNGLIIAHQVGLPTPSEQLAGEDQWPDNDIDTAFTKIEGLEFENMISASSLHTTDLPTLDMDTDTLVEKINSIESWNEELEFQRLRALVNSIRK